MALKLKQSVGKWKFNIFHALTTDRTV